MIGGEHSVPVGVGAEELWGFMADFDNWAGFVVGFRSFHQVADGVSRWVLRGDVGMLSREVELEVEVTEWVDGERAAFAIRGISEDISGSGSFSVRPAGTGAGSAPDAPGAPEPARTPWWREVRNRLVLAFLRRRRRRLGGPAETPAPRAPVPAAGGPPSEAAVLTFAVSVQPGGPMAPMLELLMSPLLEPAAEDMAGQVKAALEGGDR